MFAHARAQTRNPKCITESTEVDNNILWCRDRRSIHLGSVDGKLITARFITIGHSKKTLINKRLLNGCHCGANTVSIRFRQSPRIWKLPLLMRQRPSSDPETCFKSLYTSVLKLESYGGWSCSQRVQSWTWPLGSSVWGEEQKLDISASTATNRLVNVVPKPRRHPHSKCPAFLSRV